MSDAAIPPAPDVVNAPAPLPTNRDRAPVSSAVLLREAARASRQWRTYAARAVFSGLLMSVVLATVGLSTTAMSWFGPFDTANFGSMGRSLFIGFSAIEILIAMVLAPIMVSRSVIEEREDRTLELLVLSKLSPAQILLAKIASSLLVIATIVIGGMPVLSLVTSLGGVSVIEVIAVTMNAFGALVLLGSLGGFFALFTRSQVLSVLAAVAFSLPVFLIAPWVLALVVGDPLGATWMGPFYGAAAEGWAAMLPAFAWAPLTYRALRIGTNVFAARTANVTFGRLFHGEVWRLRGWLVEGGVLLAFGIVGVPVLAVASWSGNLSSQPMGTGLDVALFAVRGVLWLYAALVASWLGWIYLRLASEWVIALDAMFGGSSTPSAKDRVLRSKRVPAIGVNPVLWREMRGSTLSTYLVMGLLWILGMWALFQSLLWIIPGGLLTIGLANLALSWFGVAWLASSTIEKERREGTLELLLTTTIASWKVVAGKAVSITVPTLPPLLLGSFLVVFGIPHALLPAMFDDATNSQLVDYMIRGVTVGIWSMSFWLLASVCGLIVALRLKNPKQAFGVNLGGLAAVLVLPWMLAVAFPHFTPIFVTMRALVPVVAVRGPWWEPLPAAFFTTCLAVALYILLAVRLRPWAADALR